MISHILPQAVFDALRNLVTVLCLRDRLADLEPSAICHQYTSFSTALGLFRHFQGLLANHPPTGREVHGGIICAVAPQPSSAKSRLMEILGNFSSSTCRPRYICVPQRPSFCLSHPAIRPYCRLFTYAFTNAVAPVSIGYSLPFIASMSPPFCDLPLGIGCTHD